MTSISHPLHAPANWMASTHSSASAVPSGRPDASRWPTRNSTRSGASPNRPTRSWAISMATAEKSTPTTRAPLCRAKPHAVAATPARHVDQKVAVSERQQTLDLEEPGPPEERGGLDFVWQSEQSLEQRILVFWMAAHIGVPGIEVVNAHLPSLSRDSIRTLATRAPGRRAEALRYDMKVPALEPVGANLRVTFMPFGRVVAVLARLSGVGDLAEAFGARGVSPIELGDDARIRLALYSIAGGGDPQVAAPYLGDRIALFVCRLPPPGCTWQPARRTSWRSWVPVGPTWPRREPQPRAPLGVASRQQRWSPRLSPWGRSPRRRCHRRAVDGTGTEGPSWTSGAPGRRPAGWAGRRAAREAPTGPIGPPAASATGDAGRSALSAASLWLDAWPSPLKRLGDGGCGPGLRRAPGRSRAGPRWRTRKGRSPNSGPQGGPSPSEGPRWRTRKGRSPNSGAQRRLLRGNLPPPLIAEAQRLRPWLSRIAPLSKPEAKRPSDGGVLGSSRRSKSAEPSAACCLPAAARRSWRRSSARRMTMKGGGIVNIRGSFFEVFGAGTS